MPRRLFYILVFIITALLWCIPASALQKSNSRDRLTILAWQFAQEVLDSPTDAKTLQRLRSKSYSDSAVYASLRNFGREMFERGEQAKAFDYLRQALDILDDNNTLSKEELNYKASCYLMLGAATDEVGMNQLSLDYYLKGLKISEDMNNHIDVGRFYNNIGVCYLRTNDMDKALDYFNKALELNSRYKNPFELSINYSNISEIYLARKDFDTALEYALKSIQSLDEKRAPYDYYSMQYCIGRIYMKKGEYPMAQSWLDNAYNHQKKHNYKNGVFYTALSLMELADLTDNEAAFEKYRNEASNLADEADNFMLRAEYYKTTSALFYARGDTKTAYQLAEKIIAVQDSAYQAENKSRMQQSLSVYNLDKRTKEYEGSVANWNPVTVLIVCGSFSLIILVLLLLLIRRYRRSMKTNREKQEAGRKLASLNEQLLQEEKLRSEAAKKELDDNRRILASVTLERIITNQTIEEVIKESKQTLLSLSNRDKDNREHLKNIISKLSSVDNEVNWEEFQLHFTKVNPDFYRRLGKIHPELTPKDRRLCALISLGLSTKEIAALTFREVRSVETSRNRLRKKLLISTDVNLEDYLLHITSKTDDSKISDSPSGSPSENPSDSPSGKAD